MNIYVSNLSFNIQDDDLKGFFTPYGEVSSAKVIMDKFTNQSRGFGFVEMSDNEAAAKPSGSLTAHRSTIATSRWRKPSRAKIAPQVVAVAIAAAAVVVSTRAAGR
jgi:hypothetical protein